MTKKSKKIFDILNCDLLVVYNNKHIADFVVTDRLLLAIVISVLYILAFQNHSTNAIQKEMIIG